MTLVKATKVIILFLRAVGLAVRENPHDLTQFWVTIQGKEFMVRVDPV